MALVSIGSSGSMISQLSNAVGSNAITNALGFDFGNILTPSKFLTKFTPKTVFSTKSLAFDIRTTTNFDVIFHWFPRFSQIRSMISDALGASDTDDINLFVESVEIPNLEIDSTDFYNRGKIGQSIIRKGLNGQNKLKICFLNTEFSLVAHCFYQWISETESPFWIYGPSVVLGNSDNPLNDFKTLNIYGDGRVDNNGNDISTKISDTGVTSYEHSQQICENSTAFRLHCLRSQSECAQFTRADIEVKYYSGNMKELHSVWFMGAYPCNLGLESLNNKEAKIKTSAVTFEYDSMCISTPFVPTDSGTFTSAAASLGGSASWTAGLYDDSLTQIGNTYLAKASRKLNKITNKTGDKMTNKLKSLQSKVTA